MKQAKKPTPSGMRKKMRQLEIATKRLEDERKKAIEELKLLKAQSHKVQLNVRIDASLSKQLKEIADAESLTLASVVEEGLEMIIDYYRTQRHADYLG